MKVLFINAPGLHIGFLGCYGNDWVDTRSMDQLAAEGVVFDRHYADCPGASPSVLTGRIHFPRLPGNVHSPNLAEILPAHAVEFLQVNDIPELKRFNSTENGLAYIEAPELLPPWNIGEEFLTHYFDSADDNDPDDSETEEGNVPLLNPPPTIERQDLERLQLTYAAAVADFDSLVGEVLELISAQHDSQDIAVIVASERGLALGEHHIVGDIHPWLHEEVVHLPLIVRLPDGQQAGRRIPSITQPVDLFATLLALFQIPIPECASLNLLPLLRGEKDKVRDRAVSACQIGNESESSLRTLEWTFLLPGDGAESSRRPQLYAKPDDRWEINDVSHQNPEVAEQMENELGEYVKRFRESESA